MQENEEREGPWRRLLLSGGAILGAAAAYNAFARKGVDNLTNLIGGEEGGFEWRDKRIAFTKRGEGPPILLLHGIHAAGWSYEWRNNVDALSRNNTVYTIDLLGFGLSARPAVRYSARLYISLISDFVSRVIDEPCVLVASSLSGAYAIVLAARDPHRFPALALIAPTGLVSMNEPVGIGGEAGRLAVDTPIAGTAMFNALVSRPNLRRFLRNAYSDDTLVTRELVEIYYAASHQRGARHAPAAYLSGHLNIDVRHALRRLSQPALLVWGEQGSAAPVEEFRGFRELKRDFEISVLSPAGDLPHDERAQDFNVILSTWLNRLSLSSAPTLDTLPGTRADSPPTRQLL
ncbi:MAG TPA: alpha/beta fold hydrolase [Gemmatimonadaceae bacterium]|nr:alpha/beta fold hydrolase [Gemmatimonadaceae bacterium]